MKSACFPLIFLAGSLASASDQPAPSALETAVLERYGKFSERSGTEDVVKEYARLTRRRFTPHLFRRYENRKC